MKLKSLGIKTDLMFFKQNGIVEDRGDYILVRSPDNPGFFWGNLLIFPNPPEKGDFEKWIDLFKKEFSGVDDIEHMTFEWGSSRKTNELEKFEKAGFEYDETDVLIAENGIEPEFVNKDIVMKKIVSIEDWRQIIDFQIEVNPDGYDEEHLRPFTEKRFKDYKSYSDSGLGNWYAAYESNKIVADLGLYSDNGVSRFQSIKTHESYRKKGIAQTLMKYAADDIGGDYFVIQAEDDGPAINMYKTIGFKPLEVISGICLYDKEKWSSDN